MGTKRIAGSRPHNPSLSLGMFGTRGVPAAYGGFETAVEEIGARLVDRGHRVTVYCRRGHHAKLTGRHPGATDGRAADALRTHLGMDLVQLPTLRTKTLETLSHTAVSSLHHLRHRETDVNFMFDAANSPFIRLLRAGRTPVAVHVDGLEWKRAKWAGAGRIYYRIAESIAVRGADALIADAVGIQDYYRHEFGAATTLLTYGAPLLADVQGQAVEAVGLSPRGYHLVVARMEPENHVHLIVDAYRRSRSTRPLVVVGTAPYGAEYVDRLHRAAADDPRIRFMGGVWDQRLLDQLYGNALSYVHGHSVGGTNPSLLRAMGAGAVTLAFDVVFNREVLGPEGRFFRSEAELALLFESTETAHAEELSRIRSELRHRAATHYDWDAVTDGYEQLALALASGTSSRGRANGRRRHEMGTWTGDETALASGMSGASPDDSMGFHEVAPPIAGGQRQPGLRSERNDGKVRER